MLPFSQEESTWLDFSKKRDEIPSFFFDSKLFPQFKHFPLGQIAPQIWCHHLNRHNPCQSFRNGALEQVFPPALLESAMK